MVPGSMKLIEASFLTAKSFIDFSPLHVKCREGIGYSCQAITQGLDDG